jgi:uncharacterized membrane protein
MSYEPPQPPQPPGPPSYNQPPPGGGYGAPPPGSPPPAPGGYGGGGLQPYSAGDAFSYGWGKFQQNVGQMIIATLAIFVGALVILGGGMVLVFAVLAGSAETCGYNSDYTEYSCSGGGLGFFATMALMALTFGLFFIYAQVVGAGLIRASLNVTNGLPFRTADVFKFDNLGPVIVASILVGLGVMIGSVLCYIPGLIFGFFSSYTLYFLVDQNLAPVDAIKASFNFVNKNLGSTIIWYLLSLVIMFIGEILCGVGLLVAIPVVLVGTAYTYKKLNGAPVAP